VPSDSTGSGLANRITSTYNTSSDDYATINYSAQEDPDAKQNLPTYGRRRVLGHGNELTCYLLGRGLSVDELESRVPGYIRLGKKRGKARVETDPLDVSEGDGEFDLGHPIGAYDTSLTPIGNLVTKRMRPTPLVMQASYEGAYVELKSSDPDDDGINSLLTQRSSRPNDEGRHSPSRASNYDGMTIPSTRSKGPNSNRTLTSRTFKSCSRPRTSFSR